MMAEIQKPISPVDGSVYVESELATPAQLEQTLQPAVTAQPAWTQTSREDRADRCERMTQYMIDHAQDIATEIAWQVGRPIKYAPGEIMRGFQERARHMIAIAPEALADIATTPKAGFQRFIRREPVGVVLV